MGVSKVQATPRSDMTSFRMCEMLTSPAGIDSVGALNCDLDPRGAGLIFWQTLTVTTHFISHDSHAEPYCPSPIARNTSTTTSRSPTPIIKNPRPRSCMPSTQTLPFHFAGKIILRHASTKQFVICWDLYKHAFCKKNDAFLWYQGFSPRCISHKDHVGVKALHHKMFDSADTVCSCTAAIWRTCPCLK